MPHRSRLLAANPGLDLRLSADQRYPLFPSDSFDADTIYGEPRRAGLNVRFEANGTIPPTPRRPHFNRSSMPLTAAADAIALRWRVFGVAARQS